MRLVHLPLQILKSLGIHAHPIGNQFQGNILLYFLIQGQPHRSHPSLPQFALQGEAAISQSGTLDQPSIALPFNVNIEITNPQLLTWLYGDSPFHWNSVQVGA